MKILILDSGILINLSLNGLIYIIEELKRATGARFLITNQVKYETIDRPINVPRFELEALEIRNLLNENKIELPEALGISSQEINKRTNELMETANHAVQANGKWIRIVSDAEMSCLALSSILTEEGIENMIAIDERTTRLLAEKPENLENIMASRLHTRVSLAKNNFQAFSKFRFIRSTELVYVACKKNLLHVKGEKALEAVLFATKFHGSSVSYDEINELKRL